MIALVDCNNFFASCERLFRPDLLGKPVLVLSNNDGCVVARSDEVKTLGVPMGVPYFKIRDIVTRNNVQCFSSNFALYSNISQRIIELLGQRAPRIEVYSIDEAFMDLSEVAVADIQQWGENLRLEIKTNIGMPVSIGVAPTKTLAKLASSYAKKHQQTCIIDPFKNRKLYEKILKDTEVGSIWGIGWRLAQKLHKSGIRTALQLSEVSEQWIHSQMGINGTKMLHELNGRPIHKFEDEKEPQKTLMASRSFGHTVRSTHDLESAVATFASQAAYRLRSHAQTAGLFGVYLRYKTKDGQTKSQTAATHLIASTNDTSELVGIALQLMYELYDPDYGYKKAGVFANQLSSDSASQLNMFDSKSVSERERRAELMKSLDQINHRFGANTVYISSIDPKTTKWHALKKRMSPAYVTDWSQLPLVYSQR